MFQLTFAGASVRNLYYVPVAAVAALGAAPASLGQVCEDQQTLTASDAAANDEFAISVAISDDTVVVGSRRDDNAGGVDAGAAYVYVRSGPPGNEIWTQQAKLIGSNVNRGYAGSETGISVAVSGDTAIVGSWLWPSVQAIGAAYVFVRSGPPGSEVWTQQAFLTNTGFSGAFQYFGYSVALQGDTALVGGLQQPGLNVAGLAIFFERTGPPGGESWTPQAVHPSDGVVGDQFGNSVALSASGDTAVIGAYVEDNASGDEAGSAYVFIKSGNTWIEQDKLTASDGAEGDRFGVKVAIAGDTAVVGAYLDNDDNVGVDTGSVYVFTRSGTAWTETAKLTATDAAAGDAFGVSLAIGGSGGTIVIGANADNHAGGSDAGSAYVFTRSGPPGNEVWTEQQKLISPNPAADDWFGVAVALDSGAGAGHTPVIGARQDDNTSGANAGSAYIFDCLEPKGPTCPADIVDSLTFQPPPDGNVNGADLAFMLGEWGANPGSPADIVTSATFQPPPDGIVDAADLAFLLGNWGPCN